MRSDRGTEGDAANQCGEWLTRHGIEKTPIPIEDDVLLTDIEIMKICRISKATKKNWEAKYGLPRPFRIGQTPYTKRSEFVAWLDARKDASDDFQLPHHLKGRPSPEQPEA